MRLAGVSTLHCLALTPGGPPAADANCQTARSEPSILLAAPCNTRRLSVAVAAAPGTRVFADTGAGSPLAMRMRDGAGVLTLKPASGLRALTQVRGKRRTKARIDAPPASRSCGWTATAD